MMRFLAARLLYWFCGLCLLTACTQISETEGLLSTGGEGVLSLGHIQVEANVDGSIALSSTKGTSNSYDAPLPEALTYTITNTQSSESKVFSYNELIASLVLAKGNYTLTATYGSESMGTTPYLYYTVSFSIQALQTTRLPNISVPPFHNG